MAVSEVCPTNQFEPSLLLKAIDEIAKQDQQQSALNGRIVPIEHLREVIRNRWLDQMMPAGNA
jgi:hypothetical protein